MPVLAALTILLQISFAVHCVRSGRDRMWLSFIIFVPLIGCAAYFFTQVWPELGDSKAARSVKHGLVNAIDPHRELKRRKDELAISDNIDNRVKLADECMDAKLFDEAEQLYRSCLRGQHETDPNIMLKLARAEFAQDAFGAAQTTLEKLVELNPNFQSTSGHLLYARTLEHTDTTAARREYDALVTSYPGEQARVRYAQLLQREGAPDIAAQLFEETLTRARRAPKYYQRAEKQWIDIARQHARGTID